MRTVKVAGRVLTASAEDRTITGLLLPYGEVGRTSIGSVTVSAGAVTVPEDVSSVVLNIEHDDTRPVGRASSIEETEAGLVATFAVARTRTGDDLLEEAAEGLRAALSVEIDNTQVKSGALIGGDLIGAGAVVRPAFPSAQLVAADYGMDEHTEVSRETTYTDPDGTQTTVTETTETTRTSETTEQTPDDDDTDEDDEILEDTDPQEEDEMGNTTAAARVQAGTLAASRAGRGTAPAGGTKSISATELFKMLAGAQKDGGRALHAALSDIVPGDVLGMEQPQYVGELWDGKAYERRIIPLFNHDDLDSFEVTGWRWVTKPVVAPYAGNKTAVPSNKIKTEQVKINAERIAGAHDIDRKFRDFNDTAFFEAYFAAMTESYAKVSDAQVLADVVEAATDVTPGELPADVPRGLVYVVDGALAVLNETDTAPSFAVVSTSLWRDILLTPKDKTLEYLSSGLGLESGDLDGFRLIPSASIDAGSVLVGAKDAVTVHELGGPAPIRVEALDVARGGVDEGVFGYYAVNVHDAGGLAHVAAPAAG